jgi:hypothetical protein
MPACHFPFSHQKTHTAKSIHPNPHKNPSKSIQKRKKSRPPHTTVRHQFSLDRENSSGFLAVGQSKAKKKQKKINNTAFFQTEMTTFFPTIIQRQK